MKTHILQLEPHDDIVSTRDKLAWAQAARIVLVWPGTERVLNRRLDLLLLQREAGRLGAQIALVTSDSQVRLHAGELQIPVFHTLKEAQRKHWRSHRTSRPALAREDRPPDLPVRLADQHRELHPLRVAWHERRFARPAFYTFTFLALLALAAVMLPTARLELSPAVRSQELQVSVQAGPGIENMSYSGQLPAQPVKVVVEGRASLPVSGQVRVPQQAARGWVRLTNLTDREIQVPERTVVVALDDPPVRFITTKPGTVKAGQGSSTSLPVQALLLGESGNLPAGRLTALEGPVSLSVSVVNLSPLSGGSSLLVPGPSQQDYHSLYSSLTKTLRQTALDELRSGPGPGAFPLEPSLRLKSVIEKVYQPEALSDGSPPPAEQISLTLRLEYEALVVPADELLAFTSGVLDANLPEGFVGVPDTIEVHPLGPYQPANATGSEGKYSLDILVQRKIKASFDNVQAAALAAGLEINAAENRLREALPLSESPIVLVQPAWWPRLPLLPARIEVLIDGSAG